MSAQPLPFTGASQRQAQIEADQWMKDDLAHSGLTPEQIGASATVGAGPHLWPEVSIDGTKDDTVNVSVYVSSYYSIPYWTPEGEPLDGVVVRKPRFKSGTPLEVRKQKYARPSKKMVGDRAVAPYLHPARLEVNSGGVLDIHEGEKKAACAVLQGQCAIGIAGCHNWGDPEQKGRVHPWIVGEVGRLRAAIGEGRVKVRLWADADYKSNPNVGHAFSALASALEPHGVDVVLMDLSVMGEEMKFDDLVAALGYDTVISRAVEVPASELPENPEALARKYKLLSQPSGPAKKLLPLANLDNFSILLEQHPRFVDPVTGATRLWLDTDRQRPMLGDVELVENRDDTEITRFFQRHLGFAGTGRNATLPAVREAIAYQLTRNQRSPFADRVRVAAARLRTSGPEAMKAADALLDSWVLQFLHAPDDVKGFNRRWGRKFLMSIVGRALKPGCFMRTAYVIAGPQDIGKSSFMEAILGKSYVKIIRDENSQHKDLPMTYASCLVAVHDEMQAMTSRSMQAVKSDISATVDSIRLPYGKLIVDMPRRCVFLIPVDRKDFLIEDAAGMTRFAVLNLLDSHEKGHRFDFDGMTAAADDLLGAAWIAVESGEVFDVVEGAEDSARQHVKADLNMEQIVDAIESSRFASMLREGDYKGRRVVGFKLTDLAAQMPPGFKPAGGGSAVLTGPLRKLGFENAGPDVKVVGERKLWFMDKAAFDEKFVIERRKFDV